MGDDLKSDPKGDLKSNVAKAWSGGKSLALSGSYSSSYGATNYTVTFYREELNGWPAKVHCRHTRSLRDDESKRRRGALVLMLHVRSALYGMDWILHEGDVQHTVINAKDYR